MNEGVRGWVVIIGCVLLVTGCFGFARLVAAPREREIETRAANAADARAQADACEKRCQDCKLTCLNDLMATLGKGVPVAAFQFRWAMGEPDHTQVVGGVKYWYYPRPEGGTMQCVIEHDLVTHVNLY